jgi:hypothetical protein
MLKNILHSTSSQYQLNPVKPKTTQPRTVSSQEDTFQKTANLDDYSSAKPFPAEDFTQNGPGISLWKAGLASVACLGAGIFVTGFTLKWGKGSTVTKTVVKEVKQAGNNLSAEGTKAIATLKSLANEVSPNRDTYLQSPEALGSIITQALAVKKSFTPFTEEEVTALKTTLRVPRHPDFEPPNEGSAVALKFDNHALMSLPESVSIPNLPTETPLGTVSVDDIEQLSIGTTKNYDIATQDKQFFPLHYKEPDAEKVARKNRNANAPDVLPVGIAADRKHLGEEQETDFEIEYGNIWGVPKITRDFLQNFFDAHREAETGKSTLEGVKIAVAPTQKNNETSYCVTVKGDALYPVRFAEGIGATSKKGDASAAGGFGEGAKMAALSLLGKAESKVEAVTFACDNWQVRYTKNINADNIEKLYKTVTRLEQPIEGNTLTIETKNPETVASLLEARSYFYHPQNPDFMNPTYENTQGGFKLINNDNGNFYCIGQRQEAGDSPYTSQFEKSIQGMHLWSNQKDVLKNTTNVAGRDRTALSHDTINDIVLTPMVKAMTNEALLKNLKLLQNYWDRRQKDTKEPFELAKLIAEEMEERNLYSQFPETFAAMPDYYAMGKTALWYAMNEHQLEQIAKKLEGDGFIICNSEFHSAGMQSILERQDIQNHYPSIKPTEPQTIRLNLLNRVAVHLRDVYQQARDKGYTFGTEGSVYSPALIQDEMLTLPVYIYDETEGLNKEHIQGFVKGREYIGVSKKKLASDFSQALATYMHEILHYHGGDETSTFSYKLTDLNELILKTTPQLAEKLLQYEKFWNDSLAEEAALTAGA